MADHELLAHTEEAVVFFGHSHIQFQREAEGGRLLVNPGSVGLPFDGDRRAAYALWQGGRDVELRRVEYDSDGYAASVRDRMAKALGPGVETIVRRIQQAAIRAIGRQPASPGRRWGALRRPIATERVVGLRRPGLCLDGRPQGRVLRGQRAP